MIDASVIAWPCWLAAGIVALYLGHTLGNMIVEAVTHKLTRG